MTEHDPGEGYFDHLDDPSWAAPGTEALPAAVRRGRQLQARRRAVFATSTAVAVTAAVFGGLGVSHALQADGGPSDHIVPLDRSPSVTASPSPTGHRGDVDDGGGTQVLVPGATSAPGVQPSPTVSPSATAPPPADPCAAAGGESPAAAPPAEASLPPVAPSPSPTCTTATPSPSASPTESPSASPSDTAAPSESPAG